MSEVDKSEARRGVSAAERSILSRVSFDAWLEQCRQNHQVFPYALPHHYSPVPRDRAVELLEEDDAADDEHRRRFKQNVASLYMLGDANSSHHLAPRYDPVFAKRGLRRFDKLDPRDCRCCHAARALSKADSIWHLRHRFTNGTIATFNPQTQVTDFRSTYYVSGPKDVSEEQVAAMMKALADHLDPQNWSHDKGSTFKRSDPTEVTKKPKRDKDWFEGGMDWEGKLIESFEWPWNPDASMAIENLLDIKFQVRPHEINLGYSLSESLSSKLWLARQAGGLDIDRGSCTVTTSSAKKELKVSDPRHPPNVIDFQARAPGKHAFADSAFYNIVVMTTKKVRFTPVQSAPSWFSTLINYQTPVLGGIWMSQAVQTGLLRAIEATGHTKAAKHANDHGGTGDLRIAI